MDAYESSRPLFNGRSSLPGVKVSISENLLVELVLCASGVHSVPSVRIDGDWSGVWSADDGNDGENDCPGREPTAGGKRGNILCSESSFKRVRDVVESPSNKLKNESVSAGGTTVETRVECFRCSETT